MSLGRSLALAGLWLAVCARPASALETMPLDQVRPGMVGEGLTVFSGDKLEPFKVEILGVLRNFGPKQNLILARLEGGPLAQTGIIAGMSGSPVYLEGKLVGAVAYSFPFSTEPIAGITPIEEMIAATEGGAPRKRMRAMSLPLDPPSLRRFETIAPPAVPPLAGVVVEGTSPAGEERLAPYLGRIMAPIATPASLDGFTQESFGLVAPLLRQLGLEPLRGGAVALSTQAVAGGPSSASATAQEIRPGDAIGVGLISGDFDISAVGTVTHVDPATGNVYAFGHPMFNLGPIEYPMTRANVHLVIPNLQTSFKLASTGEVVGTWLQDRISALRGVRGTKPKMVPLSVTVATSRGQERSYQLQLVNDELFSPVLTFVSLISILQATEREFGTHTVKVSAWISVAGERRVNIEDVFAEGEPALAASAMVAAPLSFLMTNDFKALDVREVKVALEASETPQTSTLVRAWLDRSRASPGATVPLKLLLRSYRGEESLKTVDVEIPANIGEGKLQLLVADATTVSSIERREMGERFTPRNLDQLIRAINGLRKNNRLYVRLTRNEPGAIVRGEYLSSLPPSVLNVLSADRSSGAYIPIQSSTLWESELLIDQSVSGARVLEIEVKNP